MSNFPNKIDDDVTLPPVNNNITEIGGDAINALREAVLNIEEEIGIGASGALDSIAARINVSIDGDGYIRPSALDLSTVFPIKDAQVAGKEPGYDGIAESKLDLDYGTSALYGYYKSLASKTLTNEDWINNFGSKIYSHVFDGLYPHYSESILISEISANYLKNRFSNTNPADPASTGSETRDNSNLYNLLVDLNSDYVIHQKMDGYALSEVRPVTTLSGDSYPSNFAHTASGIYLNSSNYSSIPTSIDDVQKFADYVDSNSMMLLGSRVQSLFTSGISRASRSSSLTNDGHGINVIPETTATCYLTGGLDNPSTGDDVIELKPTDDQLSNLFASKFASVKVGDIATVTYTNFGSQALVATGTNPVATATHPDGDRAFAINYDTNSLSVIDLVNKSSLGTYQVGEGPKSIAITPDGSKAVIANYKSGNVTLFDANTYATIATISCGTNPTHVRINNSGTLAVIANEGSNNVSIVNLTTNTLTINVTCGTKPNHCSINEDDAIAAVVNSGSDNVTFINLVTYQVISTITCGANPVAGEFYSSNSNFLVVNKNSNNISFIRTNSGIPTNVVATIPVGTSPVAVATTPNGKVAVVINNGSASLNLIDLVNEKSLSIVYCDNGASSVSITNNGTKALITCSTNKLNVLSLDTNKIIAKIDVGTNPTATAITENSEKAVVVNSSSNNVTLININDIGVFETQYTVREKKSVWQDSGTKYSIRIDGKNLFDSTTATVKIDRSLYNVNKGGALSISSVKSNEDLNSLIISQPRGAVAIGNGFNASEFSSGCYNLYLILYPNGSASDFVALSAIDVTGDKGSKPGSYTLEKIIDSTNKEFRRLNYRFNAFSYNGQFGIMLADSYRNASFSIVAGTVNASSKIYEDDNVNYPNNIIRYSDGIVSRDPLGFSVSGSNVASPSPGAIGNSPTATLAAQFPTKIFYPLKRNNFYIDGAGTEIEKFSAEKDQLIDSNGDGYWLAKLTGVDLSNFDFTYTIDSNLKSSALFVGKTAVVQSLNNSGIEQNFRRFVIKELSFGEDSTDITFEKTIVNRSVASLPDRSASAGDGYDYAIYFNGDSVAFNRTNVFEDSDEASGKNFKKNYEIFINKLGKSFSSERARMLITDGSYTTVDSTVLRTNNELSGIDIVKISPKLRGYLHNTTNKISLIISYNATSGLFNGYLYDSGENGSTNSNPGPISYGKNGETVRFYDETGVDYIDFKFNLGESNFSSKKISLQLFPSLSLDDELLLIASCQLNTDTKDITNVVDLRQFGNVSEKDISTSLINYINTPERLIHSNGVINGFAAYSNSLSGTIEITNGGTCLVNGKFVQLGPEFLRIPTINEIDSEGNANAMLWAICANEQSQYEFVALCDPFTGGLSGSRTTTVRNVSSSDPDDNFNINSFLFKNLVNDAKHLTPIYLLKVNVTKADDTISYEDLELNDVRRFINNEPLNNSFTWASQSSELASYFRSFDAVKNWINYYGDTSNTIKVRGTITIDSSSNDFSKFNRQVNFEGHGSSARFDIATTTFNIGQNISYKNLKFKITSGSYCTITQDSPGYCTFDNVEFFSSTNEEYLNINTLSSYNKFTNCLFSSTIKRFYITNNCTFENVIFNKLYSYIDSSDSFDLMTIGNYNCFENCKFTQLKIDGAPGDGYLINYSDVTGNNNVFDRCTFDTVSSVRNGINLRNNNRIINSTFLNDINIQRNFLTLQGGNLIDGLLFGQSIGSNSFAWIFQESEDSGYHAIQINNNNVVKNVYGGGVVCKSSDGYAVKIIGSGNLLDNINFGEIRGEQASILISNRVNNFIFNSKFRCLSKSGIYIASASVTDLDQIILDNNKITYLYTGPSIEEDDNVRSSYGGLVFVTSNAKNITIKNCLFNKDRVVTEDKCLTGQSITNLISSGVSQFPPIISLHVDAQATMDSIKIDKCKFVGSDTENKYYAAIAISSANETDKLALKNIHITNNSSTKNSGLIIAGKSDTENLTAENVIISQNNFSYISAYSSPYLINGHILIDGNSCYGIMSLTYKGINQVNSLSTTGDMTISNNSTQFINVYVAGNQ